MDFLRFIIRPLADVIRWMFDAFLPVDASEAPPRRPFQQAPECRIVQLPCELILSIADELTPQGRVFFAQTCRCIRARVGAHSAETIGNFTDLQQANFLSTLARDDLSRWYCSVCRSLHRVNLCVGDSVGGHSYRQTTDITPFTRVAYYRAQLTLKYTRTQASCQWSHIYCLQRLLAPYHFEEAFLNSQHTMRQTVKCSCFPKVALGHDGRLHYLLLAVIRYPPSRGGTHLVHDLACVDVCPNLATNRPSHSFSTFADPRTSNDRRWPLPHLAEAIRVAFENSERAGLCADVSESKEVRGGCPRCPLDFAVRVARSGIEIRLWQDLGPEVAVNDLAWRIHVNGKYWSEYYGRWQFVGDERGPAVYHRPGTIRDLYEADMEAQK